MTTITRLKQIKDWIAGKLTESRVQRSQQTPAQSLTDANIQAVKYRLQLAYDQYQGGSGIQQTESKDQFSAYKRKLVPTLQEQGYAYFLSCSSEDYVTHQEWCHDNCEDHVLPHYDLWMFDAMYPRAFASKDDAMMFKLTFDAQDIEAKE